MEALRQTARESWTDDRMDDLAQRVDAGFERVDRQFENVDKRFEQVDKRFEQQRVETARRFDLQRTEMNQRFEDQRAETHELLLAINKRIDMLFLAYLTSAFGVIAALIAT
jgi:hypothetical protein